MASPTIAPPAAVMIESLDMALEHRATPATGARGLHVDVLTDRDALERAAAQWRALETESGAAAVFQTYAQAAIWARHFIASGDRSRQLRVAVVSEGGLPLLILPLVVTSFLGLMIGHIAGVPIAQYSELLAHGQADLHACFAAALNALRRSATDVLTLRGVREDSRLAEALAPLAPHPMNRRVAPFLDMGGAADHDAFVRNRSKGLLHGMRNKRKQMDRAGTVSFDAIDGGEAAADAMREAIGLKREWLVQRGAMSSAFVDPKTMECLVDLAANAPGAVVTRLMFNGKPAALRFGFVHNGTYFAYLSAYDSEVSQFAPGKLLMDFTLQAMRERNVMHIDMLPPAGEHKAVWCDGETGVADYIVPLTLAGQAYALGNVRVKPALEWTWHHLPAATRSWLAQRFLKM